MGRKNRFGYCVVLDTVGYPTAVVKLNLQARRVLTFRGVVYFQRNVSDGQELRSPPEEEAIIVGNPFVVLLPYIYIFIEWFLQRRLWVGQI